MEKMENCCIKCKNIVRERQHAIACDGCNLWQHRTCGTGISQKDYFAAVISKRQCGKV